MNLTIKNQIPEFSFKVKKIREIRGKKKSLY